MRNKYFTTEEIEYLSSNSVNASDKMKENAEEKM